jgi:hypothetical protein
MSKPKPEIVSISVRNHTHEALTAILDAPQGEVEAWRQITEALSDLTDDAREAALFEKAAALNSAAPEPIDGEEEARQLHKDGATIWKACDLVAARLHGDDPDAVKRYRQRLEARLRKR